MRAGLAIDRTEAPVRFFAMIELTERAATRIRELSGKLAKDGQLMRIFVEAGGCSGLEYGMSFDLPKDVDETLESRGVTILIDPTSKTYLEGCRVDFDDGLQGKGFEILNPNASSTCGCGRSFN